MGNQDRTTQFDRARDELCSHVVRCEVLEADMDDRLTWLEETMDYMGERYPDLTELELAQLELIGRRFVQPAIPHGAHAHAANRDRWEDVPEGERQEVPEAEPEADLAGAA
ncbi:MAG: hypothetical protein U5R14_03760 [Gemmatimonadota bacterium]|nr:hypothetical protein [Gemmatimonadota bacterium]